MILCDMDGVLAMGPSGDTEPGEPIYRSFTNLPAGLERIREAGIPLHVVTAKVEAEAAQVLEAVGLGDHVRSIVGADRLFWPSVWRAVRGGRIPRSVVKSVYRDVLSAPERRRIVMIEDRRRHLCEMLAADAIDFGVLVPPIVATDERIASWFDLDLALRVALGLALATLGAAELSGSGVAVLAWRGGELAALDEGHLAAGLDEGRLVLELPPLPADVGSGPPTLASLDTGRTLQPGGRTVIAVVRAALRFLRRAV